MKKICIVGASGKLGQYMIQHALDRGYEVIGVCRPESVTKLSHYRHRIRLIPGRTNDREAIRLAVADCDAVLTVLAPWGVDNYASGTAQAVLDFAPTQARLIFSCGWHISKDGLDNYSFALKAFVAIFGRLTRLFGLVDLDDQVRATRLIFDSHRRWTVVRGSDLEEGDSEGLPIWRELVGDPALASNRTRRTDFALFMIEAINQAELIQKAPAIVSRASKSAQLHYQIS
jgi:hypothetical protein